MPMAERIQFLRTLQPDTHIYVCGPRGMMDFVGDAASAYGHAESNVHLEFFGAITENAQRAFAMRLARSGRILNVPADRTALDVLIEHQIQVPFSCEQGVCGTCKTRIIEGLPDHRDQCLTAKERAANTVFTPCCSRSATPTLVLDL
jgi:vanillate O-demethylase ferredoxin subunit